MILDIADSVNGVPASLLRREEPKRRIHHFGVHRARYGQTENHMAQREPRRIVFPTRDELLAAARERVDLPPGKLWLDYQDDVDTLYVRLKEKTHPTHSKSNLDEMIVFDYEGEELVGIEIMDITGRLKYANPR